MVPEWIAAVAELDDYLHSIGTPDGVRIKAVSDIADVLAQADKARRDLEAHRAKMSAFVQECRRIGTTEAAREAGISPRGARKRKAAFYKNGTA